MFKFTKPFWFANTCCAPLRTNTLLCSWPKHICFQIICIYIHPLPVFDVFLALWKVLLWEVSLRKMPKLNTKITKIQSFVTKSGKKWEKPDNQIATFVKISYYKICALPEKITLGLKLEMISVPWGVGTSVIGICESKIFSVCL